MTQWRPSLIAYHLLMSLFGLGLDNILCFICTLYIFVSDKVWFYVFKRKQIPLKIYCLIQRIDLISICSSIYISSEIRFYLSIWDTIHRVKVYQYLYQFLVEMEKGKHSRSDNFKRKSTTLDKRSLRAHRRSIEWKQQRSATVRQNRPNMDNLSPLKEASVKGIIHSYYSIVDVKYIYYVNRG